MMIELWGALVANRDLEGAAALLAMGPPLAEVELQAHVGDLLSSEIYLALLLNDEERRQTAMQNVERALGMALSESLLRQSAERTGFWEFTWRVQYSEFLIRELLDPRRI